MLPDLKSIRTRREKLGIKLIGLSRATGIKPAMLSMIESGRALNAGYEKVRKIFDYLDKQGTTHDGRKAWEICIPDVKGISQQDTLEKARDIMISTNFSQLPVFKREECVGLITEHDIMTFVAKNNDKPLLKTTRVKSIMGIPPIIVPSDYPINQEIVEVLINSNCILVSEDNKISGIITPSDTIKKSKNQKKESDKKKKPLIL